MHANDRCPSRDALLTINVQSLTRCSSYLCRRAMPKLFAKLPVIVYDGRKHYQKGPVSDPSDSKRCSLVIL